MSDRSVGGQVVTQGEWLVEHRCALDRGEAEWLLELAGFDRDQGWALDGQLSCVDWLVWRARMARGTAYEKLLVARQMARRPLLADALAGGRVSYSAVRAISRIEDPDPEVDAALLQVAEVGTVADVDKAVRAYQLHADQHRPPIDPGTRRGLTMKRGLDGTSTIEVTLADIEIEEVLAALRAAMDRAVGVEAVVDSAAAESEASPVAPLELPSYPAMRADALMDLVRSGLVALDSQPPGGADRYMVHLVREAGRSATLADGSPVDPALAATVACDCSTVEHHTGDGEPLYLGRRQRVWSTAQRRAILIRDRATCRFPGCHRRIADIHHIRWWEHGGQTDVDNGLLICPRHHTMLHTGYDARGDANHPVVFVRADGSVVGRG